MQLGQCGNQIGASLFDLLWCELTDHIAEEDRKRGQHHRLPRRGSGAGTGAGAGAGAGARSGDVSGRQLEAATASPFFREVMSRRGGKLAAVARAVLIDMEPKVVAAQVAEASGGGRWRYALPSVWCGVLHA